MIKFPDYIFTQMPEARHLPDTISIDGELMIKLLDNVCREIARNGCKKIVLLNAHGGNFGLVALYNMLQLYAPKDYVVYIVSPLGAMSELERLWPREDDGHAGPGETSIMLALRPDLVDMSKIPADDEGKARGRLQPLREAGVQIGIWWYADHPRTTLAMRRTERPRLASASWTRLRSRSRGQCARSRPTRPPSSCRASSSPRRWHLPEQTSVRYL